MHKRTHTIQNGLALILVLILTACGSNTTPTEEAPAPADHTPTIPLQGTGAPALTPTEQAQPQTTSTTPAEAAATPTPSGPVPLWSVELKQAFAAAIDREAIVDRVFEGLGTPAYHMVPTGYPFSTDPFFTRYGTRDLNLAVSLLSGLGYTADVPFEIDLWYPEEEHSDLLNQVMEVIAEQLEETGLIRVHLQSSPWEDYLPQVVEGQMPVFILGWQPDFVDPHNWISPFTSCDLSGKQGVGYCNPVMEDLILREVSSADEAQRAAVFQRIGELYAEEVPTLPLYWEPEFMAARSGVEGIRIGPAYIFSYDQLGFSENASPAAQSPDTLTIGTTAGLDNLDALVAESPLEIEILHNTSLPLLRYEPGTASLLPGAAEDYPFVNSAGTVYTFTLRSGLQFSDGTPLDSSAYLAAWGHIENTGSETAELVRYYIDRVEAPDETTLVFHLTGAYRFFPALAASPVFTPLYPGSATSGMAPGSGAYYLAEYTPGESVVLELNPHRIEGDITSIPRILIRMYPDAAALSDAVERGEIDIAWHTLGLVETFRLQSIDGITVHQITAPNLRYLVFNHSFLVSTGDP